MAIRGRASLALLLVASSLPAPAAYAVGDGEAGLRHAAWRGCLNHRFHAEPRLAGPTRAADAALLACRDAESAYLVAMSASPLLDGEDIARARPALLERAKGWLLGRDPSSAL